MLAVLAVSAPRAEGEEPNTLPVVEIASDTTWSGEVKVEGRVLVRETATLRITSGTRIVIGGGPRFERATQVRRLPGIEVSGSLIAEGTPTAPITFLGMPPDKRGQAEWNGILLEKGAAARRHEMRACVFHHLSVGIQDVAANTLIERCTFCDCRTAINAGMAFRDDRVHVGVAHGASRIRSCRFGWCEGALRLGFHSRAEVSRCWFLECKTGVQTSSGADVQQILERCEFEACATCVSGTCCVTNCIFERNDIVFGTWGADLTVRLNNLCVQNRVLMEDDGHPGVVRHADDVGRLGVRTGLKQDPLDQLLADRVPWATLQPTSSGRGYATDGGDVGIEGEVGAGPPAPPAPDLGARATHLLVLGPPDALPDPTLAGLVAAHAARPPRPGEVSGTLQWILLTAQEVASLHRRPGFAAPPPRVLCAVLDVKTTLEGELSLGWDGVARAWWNGTPVSLPTSSRRMQRGDVRTKVKAKAGANVLMVEQRPRLSAAALEVAFAIPREATDSAAWRAAPPAPATSAPAPAKPPVVRLGKEKSGPISLQLTISLPPGARWLELIDLAAYQLRDSAGAEIPLRDAQLTLDPRNARLGLRLAERLPAGGYELVLPRLRNAAGEDLAPAAPLAIRVPK